MAHGHWASQVIGPDAGTGSGGGSGAGGGVLVVHLARDGNGEKLDKTWREIRDAMDAGIVPAVNYGTDEAYSGAHIGIINYAGKIEDLYGVAFLALGDGPSGYFNPYPVMMTTDTEDGYPRADK